MSDTSATSSAAPSRLSGTLSGQFIETCDCKSLCPCWADDDPDENHCTGVFAWRVESGRLEGDTGDQPVDVSNARVVSISTHHGHRHHPEGERNSVFFIDVDDVAGDRDTAYGYLRKAFSEPAGGPLADLASVTGTVLDVLPAHVEVTYDDRAAAGGKAWSIRVELAPDGYGAQHAPGPVFEGGGDLLAFDQGDASDDAPVVGGRGVDDPGTEQRIPMTLSNTALHKELAAVGPVTALTATRFRVLLPALPGGLVDARDRSAMSGAFSYPRQGRGDAGTA
ncbi:DUF1326 domain-containing protein [Blastococcus deserti]|uniref:DUF1326 domain-containing protein n=1 Tax=Blastococcus deserti TaxID=2259033 RepID=A0ABW4X7U9_9ACTN